MLRDGPFPAFLHGLVEYIVGGLFIALPLLLGYDSGAATAASILIGVGVIAVAATTDWGFSLVNKIPKAAHLVLDFGIAALMIASPFIFGFSDETAPTAIFMATGVLHILLTIGTRFVKDDAAKEPEQGSRRRFTPEPTAGTEEQASSPEPAPGRHAAPEPDPAPAPAPVGDRASARRDV